MFHSRSFKLLAILALSFVFHAVIPQDGPSNPAAYPGLLCFWDFQEPAGSDRISSGRYSYALKEMNGPIERVEDGIFGPYSTDFVWGQWFRIERKDAPGLDLHGKEQALTMVAWVKRESDRVWQYIAGMWDEGLEKFRGKAGGEGPDAPHRQYAMFINGYWQTDHTDYTRTRAENQVHGYLSPFGGATPGHPFAFDYATGATKLEKDRWYMIAYTFDGSMIRVYVNGKPDPNGNCNPFPYDGPIHDGGEGGSDFTVALRRVPKFPSYPDGKPENEAGFDGRIGGLAIYDRALSAEELAGMYHGTVTGNKNVKESISLKNPLIDDPGMSDPHALVLGDVVYMFTGHDTGFGIPDWVMPDWRIYRSDDLQRWEHVGTISPADNYMGKGNTNCWAGDIVERNGRYYWYFSNRKESTGVMVASKPEGPYVDALGKPLVDSFDPSIFVDDDGTPYIVYGEKGYKIARLKESMIELDEKPRDIVIKRTTYFPDTDKNSLHKHNGIYYLSCSGYYATSEDVYGPYETKGVVGEGWGLDTGYAHGDFFIWKDDWYHVWCKYRDRDQDRIRDCFIAPVNYDPDGSMNDDLSILNGSVQSP